MLRRQILELCPLILCLMHIPCRRFQARVNAGAYVGKGDRGQRCEFCG